MAGSRSIQGDRGRGDRRRHLALSLFSASLLALSLAGCGPKGSSSEGGQTVKFLSMDYDPTSSALQKRIVDDFNRQSKDGKVDIEIVNWNDGHQKLQTLISGNQSPDLAIVAARWMTEYAQAGLLTDLSAASQHGLDTGSFVPGVLAISRSGGKLLGLPAAASVRGLYYNDALLKKAGVTPPRTWAELQDAARRVQAANPGVAGFGVQGKEVETDLYYYYFLWGAGGDILGPDGKCALASPAGVRSLDFELSLVKGGLTEPQPTGYNREDLQNLFKAGKVAMIVTGPWFAGMLKKEQPGLPFGVVAIPGESGPVTPAVADELVMFSGAANNALAWKFLAFWYSDQNRLDWVKASGMLPEKSTVADSAELKSDKDRAFFMAALPGGKYVPIHPRWEQMSNAVADSIQQALLGKMDARKALEDACEKVDGIAKGQ